MPSPRDVADMLRERRVIYRRDGLTEFDFSRIEDEDKINELAECLVKKIPQMPNVVIGFMSDNSLLSKSIAESVFVHAKHYFVPQDDNVKPIIERFNGSQEVNILLVKALINDIDIDGWYGLSNVNPNIGRISAAAIADGRFFPYENSLEVTSLIDYDHLHV